MLTGVQLESGEIRNSFISAQLRTLQYSPLLVFYSSVVYFSIFNLLSTSYFSFSLSIPFAGRVGRLAFRFLVPNPDVALSADEG